MRLFVAVWPSEEVVDAVAALPRPDVPGVRWTRREAWHVTLRFLGEVDDPLPIVSALDAAPLAPALARLGPRLAAFGRGVLVVPVAGLDHLAGGVAAGLADVRADEEAMPFRGHLTLARARRGASVRPLTGGPVAGEFAVTTVSLVWSRPGPGGHDYEVLHERPLG